MADEIGPIGLVKVKIKDGTAEYWIGVDTQMNLLLVTSEVAARELTHEGHLYFSVGDAAPTYYLLAIGRDNKVFFDVAAGPGGSEWEATGDGDGARVQIANDSCRKLKLSGGLLTVDQEGSEAHLKPQP